jgi:hypothetical protein
VILCIHDWIIIDRDAWGPTDDTDPVAHTRFAILGCTRCRTVDLFPAENAALLTPHSFARLRVYLAHQNWNLPADLTFHRPPSQEPT